MEIVTVMIKRVSVIYRKMNNKVNKEPDNGTYIALLVSVGFQVSPDRHMGYDWSKRKR